MTSEGPHDRLERKTRAAVSAVDWGYTQRTGEPARLRFAFSRADLSSASRALGVPQRDSLVPSCRCGGRGQGQLRAPSPDVLSLCVCRPPSPLTSMRTSPPNLPKSAPPSSKSEPRCAVLSQIPLRPSSTECRRTSWMAAPSRPSRDGRTIMLSTSSRLRSLKLSQRILKAARRARGSSASSSTSPCPSPSWCGSRSGAPSLAVSPLPSRRSRRSQRQLLRLLQSATLEDERLDRLLTSIQRIAILAGLPIIRLTSTSRSKAVQDPSFRTA